MKYIEIPKASGVFTRHVCRCLALILMLLYPFSAAATDRVRLQLRWQHQFQFAGYYAALAKGYYQAAGLEVEIIPCQPGEDPVQKVLQGKADFGVGSTELLLLRERGAPMVVLGVIFQHSPLVFMTLKRSGLESIHDLVGRRVVIEPGSSELYAYLREEGIPLDKLTLLPHGFDTKDLLAGNVDALSAYVTDEPFELRQAEQEYVLYSPRVAGIDFYGDNFFTTESLLKLKPEMVRAFREASLKGWKYAMQHPEELVQLIYSRYSQRHSIEHLRFEADQMAPLLQTVLVEIGHMNLGRWQHIAETYTELGMMKPDFNFNGFLYDPNPPPPDLRWLYVLIGLVALAIAVVSAITVYVHRTNMRLRQEVDERKRAESQREALLEALEESEEHYRLLFEDAVDGMAVGDAETDKFTDCNQALCRMVERDKTELVGQHQSILHPGRISKTFRLHKAGDKSQVLEDRLVSKSGKIIPVEINGTKIRIRGHDHLLGIFRDISERKQAEEALRKSREKQKLERDRLDVILKTAQDGFWLVDASTGRLIDVNDAACSMLGYSREELLRIRLTDLDAQWSPEEIGQEMQKIKTVGNAFFETRQRTRSGQIIDVEVSVNYLPDIDQFFSFIRDITERKQKDEALKETESRIRAITDSARDAILMMGPEGRISYWNPAAERILGYTSAEAIGQNLHQLIAPPRYHEAHHAALPLFQQKGQGAAVGKTLDLEAIRKDGKEISVQLSLSSIRMKGAWHAVGILRDITERKQAEEKIRQMAYHDSLTGLPNRKLFSDRLGIALFQAQRNKKEVGIAMLDLDNFKGVNDSLGHAVGDLLLKAVAERLSAAMRKGDTVARIGGDEFVLILPELKGTEDAIQVAQKIVKSFHNPFLIDTHELVVTTSIGIAVYPNDGIDEDTLLKNADTAMYQAKDAGRDRYQICKHQT